MTAGSLAFAAVFLLGLWHFGRIPVEGGLQGPLHSAAHFPVFGMLGAIIFVSLRRFAPPAWRAGWRAYAVTLLAMLVLSAVAEWSQQFTDRNASLRDVGVNMAGAVAALCLIALYDQQIAGFMRGRGLRLAAALTPVFLAILVLIPPAAVWATLIKRDADFPCLVCPENRLDLWMLEVSGASARLAREGESAAPFIEVHLDRGAFPGVAWERPARDWSGFDTLVLDLTNPGPEELMLTLRIDDAQHDSRFTDRFNHRIRLEPEARHRECIPLSAIEEAPREREMDLAQIARVMLFGGGRAQGQGFWVHHIGLEQAGTDLQICPLLRAPGPPGTDL